MLNLLKIKMTSVETGNSTVIFQCETLEQAILVNNTMNRLNETAAKMTGSALKFIYTIILNTGK